MEQVKSLQTTQSQLESYHSSQILENKLQAEEKKMFDLQFTKPTFSKFGDVELLIQVQVLVAKICVITGWNLPDSEDYKIILHDQFAKKMREDYYSLNADEVEYAFRKYGTGIEDWGKSFNLNLVDNVLVKYMNYRADLRQFVHGVEKEAVKNLPVAHEVQQTDEEFIEECYAMWFSLKNKFYQYVNHRVYDKLLNKGLINLNEEDKIRIRAVVKHDIERGEENRSFTELRHRLREIKEVPNETYFMRQCKKYAVAEYFNKLIAEGKLKVL
jgi:hypothetical protein